MCEVLNNDYNCGFSPSFGILNPLRLQKLLHQLCANTTNSAQTLNHFKNMAKKSSQSQLALIILTVSANYCSPMSNESLRSHNRSWVTV